MKQYLYLSLTLFAATMIFGVALDIIVRDYGVSGLTVGALCFMFGSMTFIGTLLEFSKYLDTRNK